ncbi:MAG TPA: hypothetical protein VE944_32845 [Nostoc sp.]|uniref:hypothetical protein n=1 Tax=Nostoc sp. TaxID=1180 RepID=UPI002D30B5D8|nr:hypothetical protein [Nostoc sp.]HYX19057.1 hypothetical protein [Nostoc sp.]
MKSYKISYWDREGEGITIIESTTPVDVEEAASAIREQLLENGIDAGEVQVEEFREIKNPVDRLITNFQRLGF